MLHVLRVSPPDLRSLGGCQPILRETGQLLLQERLRAAVHAGLCGTSAIAALWMCSTLPTPLLGLLRIRYLEVLVQRLGSSHVHVALARSIAVL